MRPIWTYTLVACRRRHRRGYFRDVFEVTRNDGKVMASSEDSGHMMKVMARYEAWALQPWPRSY